MEEHVIKPKSIIRDDKGRPVRVDFNLICWPDVPNGALCYMDGRTYLRCYLDGRTYLRHDGQFFELSSVRTGRTYFDRRQQKDLEIGGYGFRVAGKPDSWLVERTPVDKARALLLHPKAETSLCPDGSLEWKLKPAPSALPDGFLFYDTQNNVRWRNYDDAEREAEVGDSGRGLNLVTKLDLYYGVPVARCDKGSTFWNDFNLDGRRGVW